MSKDKSFDIVSKVDLAEVNNAVDQTMREIKQRYDFKGSKSDLELDTVKREIVILADDSFKLKSIVDIFSSKLIKRGISLKAINYKNEEKASGGMARQIASIQNGIPTEKAKEIVKEIKQLKLKVQATIQEDQVRVQGKNIDDLQEVIKLLREKDFGIDLKFENMR